MSLLNSFKEEFWLLYKKVLLGENHALDLFFLINVVKKLCCLITELMGQRTIVAA